MNTDTAVSLTVLSAERHPCAQELSSVKCRQGLVTARVTMPGEGPRVGRVSQGRHRGALPVGP